MDGNSPNHRFDVCRYYTIAASSYASVVCATVGYKMDGNSPNETFGVYRYYTIAASSHASVAYATVGYKIDGNSPNETFGVYRYYNTNFLFYKGWKKFFQKITIPQIDN